MWNDSSRRAHGQLPFFKSVLKQQWDVHMNTEIILMIKTFKKNLPNSFHCNNVLRFLDWRRIYYLIVTSDSQSMAMPTEMHFLKRHSWHWLRVILSMMQQPSYLQEYDGWRFFWMVLRKKPWMWKETEKVRKRQREREKRKKEKRRKYNLKMKCSWVLFSI